MFVALIFLNERQLSSYPNYNYTELKTNCEEMDKDFKELYE